MIYPGSQRFTRTLVASVATGIIVLLFYVLRNTTIEFSQPQWPLPGTITTLKAPNEDKPERIALVVASQTTDNTTWLDGSFPSWEKSIYLTDAPSNLSVPVNKGRESMVYLTFVISGAIHDLTLTLIKLHHRQLRQYPIIYDLPACQQISVAQ